MTRRLEDVLEMLYRIGVTKFEIEMHIQDSDFHDKDIIIDLIKKKLLK